jgi:hypothetical protein
MKLTSTRIDRAAEQLVAWPIPDADPTARPFNDLFGEHTFFIDDEGLSIVELEANGDVEVGRVVKLARWADEEQTYLLPHPREVTSIVVKLSGSA